MEAFSHAKMAKIVLDQFLVCVAISLIGAAAAFYWEEHRLFAPYAHETPYHPLDGLSAFMGGLHAAIIIFFCMLLFSWILQLVLTRYLPYKKNNKA